MDTTKKKNPFVAYAEFDLPKKPAQPLPSPPPTQPMQNMVRTMGFDPQGAAASYEAQRIFNPNLPPQSTPAPAAPPPPSQPIKAAPASMQKTGTASALDQSGRWNSAPNGTEQ